MKTTEDIYHDFIQFERNNLRAYQYPKDALTYYNQKWYSEKEMQKIKSQREDDEWRLEYITPISITSGNEYIAKISTTVIIKDKALYTNTSKNI